MKIAPLKWYQYISKFTPASCRYYPSCSEYAKWQFEFNAPHKAFTASALRILRCNQLFDGGIDYPIVTFIAPKLDTIRKLNDFCGKMKIIYWFVPKNTTKNQYYILKDFDAIKHSSDS